MRLNDIVYQFTKRIRDKHNIFIYPEDGAILHKALPKDGSGRIKQKLEAQEIISTMNRLNIKYYDSKMDLFKYNVGNYTHRKDVYKMFRYSLREKGFNIDMQNCIIIRNKYKAFAMKDEFEFYQELFDFFKIPYSLDCKERQTIITSQMRQDFIEIMKRRKDIFTDEDIQKKILQYKMK